MTQVFQAMVNFFKEDDWNFFQLEGEDIITMIFSGNNGEWVCYAEAEEDEEEGWFFFYSTCPVKAPEEKRHEVAEYITRANYGMRVGNFELDYEDGLIKYKTSIKLGVDELSSSIMENLVYINLYMMDRYLPGIMKVIYSDASPTQAISYIESEEN